MARRSIALLAALSAAPAAEGQFFLKQLSSSSSSRGGYASNAEAAATGAAPWSSHTVSSSRSWSLGSDGQLHEQVQTSHTDTLSNGDLKQQVKTDTYCVDGLCKQETTRVVQPTWHARARAALAARLFGPPSSGATFVRVVGPPSTGPQARAPFLRGVVVVSDQPHIVDAVSLHKAPSPPASVGEGDLQETAAYVSGCYVGICAVLITGMAIIKLLFHDKRSNVALAREPRLRMLVDPLAPIPEEVMEAGMAAMEAEAAAAAGRASPLEERPEEVAAAATGEYLQSLYAHVQGNILAEAEELSVQQYVCSLYERVAA